MRKALVWATLASAFHLPVPPIYTPPTTEGLVYRTLFALAGLAIFGWMLLIFVPGWWVTRRIADSAVFPAYLAVLYAVGVFAVFGESGPGIMKDFGSAEGVLRLLQNEGIALVAWIHILVFDQVIAHLIYRDNMKHRFLPLPVQSVLLVLTLMLGPLGFLSYYLIRITRSRSLVAWGDRAELPVDADARPVRFSDVVRERSVIGAAFGLWRRERALVLLALAGFAMGAVAAAIALIHGGWLLGAEGRLKEAVRFDVAIGIFVLTLALLLPLSGMSPTGARRWRGWVIGLVLFAFAMENVQAWRGIDPRFTKVGSTFDLVMGGVFFVQAVGLWVLFVGLTSRFFRDDALPDHPALRTALRYGAFGANLAFFVGVLMSGLQGRVIQRTGDLMAIHAAGFHGLQAIPLIALLLGWSHAARSTAQPWVHIAGTAWLLFSAGLFIQALTGTPTLAAGIGSGISLAGAALWLLALLYAGWMRYSAPAAVTAR